MMNSEDPIDRRILRTRESIRNALIRMIEQKGFEAVTVKDITTAARINRGTFYLHYRDKTDLLEQTEADIVRDVEKIFQQTNALNLTEFKNIDGPLPTLVTLFEFISDNSALMRAVLGIKGEMSFQKQIKRAIGRNLFREGAFAHIYRGNSVIPSEYLISYVVAAHLGVIQQWLNNNCRESPQEMALILSRITFNGPLYAATEKKSG